MEQMSSKLRVLVKGYEPLSNVSTSGANDRQQDDTRHWLMPGEGATWKTDAGPISNYFSAINRNKRSFTLDLKHPKGRKIFMDLAKKADVL
jgi:crotonobetainyl-CoA:carnitine CoA-transferase CaiB-like acyl-CoA transferase